MIRVAVPPGDAARAAYAARAGRAAKSGARWPVRIDPGAGGDRRGGGPG